MTKPDGPTGPSCTAAAYAGGLAVKERSNAERTCWPRPPEHMTASVPVAEDQTQSLVYAIAHDLRAPIRHIKAFVEILGEHVGTELDDTGVRYLDRLVDAADVVNARIDAITEFSRVVTHRTDLQRCDPNLLVAKALKINADEIDSGAAELIVDHLPEVVGDPSQLTTIFVELTGNALKFCHQPLIRISSRTTGGYCEISIADDGPGLRTQDCAEAMHLFRRFHPASIPGTGSGLAIVERIVETHGGRAIVESPGQSGLCVRFSIPLADGNPEAGPTPLDD